MSDLVKRLRFCADLHPQLGYPENGKLFKEAADRIEALETLLENAPLGEALKRVEALEKETREQADRIEALEAECRVAKNYGVSSLERIEQLTTRNQTLEAALRDSEARFVTLRADYDRLRNRPVQLVGSAALNDK